MAKRYDPILCMLVDEPTKAQDELKIVKEDGLWCVYKDGKVVGQSNSEAGAIRIYNRLESGKDSASALDKAIKVCDEKIRLVKTISKKNGYAIHIVEGGYGERIVLTFPNESYANPHMWLGSNNSSNIQKAKELLDEFSK